MATEEGVIIEVNLGQIPTAIVKTTRSGACENCSTKGSCSGVRNTEEVEVLNEVGASVGDTVLLNISNRSLLKAIFLIYIFPILMMIFGVFIIQGFCFIIDKSVSSGFLVFFAFLFLGLAFVIIYFIGERLSNRTEYKPKILKILNRFISV